MKRAIHRRISFLAAAIFAVAAAATTPAFAPAACAQDQAPAAPRSQTEPPSSQEPQKASGVVPPGVKLLPQMPGPSAPRPFHFPKAATMTLPNGLRVFVVTDHSEPAIAARLVILSAGSIKDPSSMPGVAQMAANLLTQGTEKRSAKDIAEGIDFIGGQLNAMAGRDATTVTLDIVKKDLATGMDLMSDVVLHPTFRAEELERQRQQLLSTLQVQYADPEYLATLVFARSVYGTSPYGLPPEGTPATVQKFQPGDFVKFRDANYAPNESLLGFAGDITPEEAFAVAAKYFGGWPKVDVPLTEPPAPSSATAQQIWLIDKPDAVQTQIRVGKIAIPRNDPDFLPLDVTNHILGGSYNSRLNTEVRIKKGLTYGASSSLNPHRYTGSLVVSTYTRTEATVEATKLVMDILTGMSQGEITQNELDFARDYLAGVYPISSETAEQVTDRVLTVAAFDLPEDYNQTYPAKIRATSLKDVQAAARKYFTTGGLDLVLAGNISAFRDALKKAFPSAEFTEIPYDQVDVLAPDLRAPKQETVPAPSAESLEEGKQILLAAAQAAGGAALQSVATLGITENGKIHGPAGDRPLDVKWQVVYPDRSYGEVNLGGMTIQQVCDGKSSWLKFPNGMRDTTNVIGEFKRGIAMFGGGWGLYQQVLAGKITGQAIGEEEIQGKKTQAVAVNASFGFIKLYFDADTHLLAAARYQSVGEHGPSANEQHWSDYRDVEGRKFAYATDTYRDGTKLFDSTVQAVEVNPKVDEALFTKPEPPAAK
ncbi:MAG: pitrilysin family protein [Candidatus Acidiferrales bacterium]